MTSKIKRGTRFLHRRILCAEDITRQQPCIVTRVDRTTVYYRSVHGVDEAGKPVLGGGACFHVDQWDRWAMTEETER